SIDGLPSAIVQTDTATLDDERIGCLLVGPGMGDIPQVLTLALTSRAPKVIDADAIGHLGDPERLKGQDAIITPHEGEFRRLFGDLAGTKPERALEAARRSGAVVVYKGPDTEAASPRAEEASRRAAGLCRSGFREPRCSTMARFRRGRITRSRLAATFRSAADVSSSMPTTRRIGVISSRGSRRRLRSPGLRPK